jgi:aminopeptidase N
VDYFGAAGYVDAPIYNFTAQRPYVNAAYLNGAHFIEDVRVRMGDDDFFRFLKNYSAKYAHGRVTAADFFATLRENSSNDINDLISEYFSRSH